METDQTVTTTGQAQSCQSCLSYLKDTFATIWVTSWHQTGYCINSNFIDELLLNLDKDNVAGLVMIDYKKAFDLIDNTLILSITIMFHSLKVTLVIVRNM